MKKILYSFISILASCNLAHSGYIEPVRTMTIPYAPIPFTIDGIDNEAHWSEEQSTIAFNTIGSTGDDADFTFTFKAAWDEQYLYIFGKILDDINNSWEWGGENPWTFDNVEVYIDLDTNGSGNIEAYDSNTYSLRINRGIDSIGNYFGRGCKRSDHKYYWKNTTDGWIFETALAWKFVLGPNQKPEDIMEYVDGSVRSGFDILGADSDTPGPDHRDCQTAWDEDDEICKHPDTGDCNSWNNRTIFGVVNFQPKYYTVDNELINENLLMYPNPTTGILHFEGLQGPTELKIVNITGEIVLISSLQNNQADLSSLPGGVYYARIANDIVKIIKQ